MAAAGSEASSSVAKNPLASQQKSLLPGEGRVGSYKDLSKTSQKGDDLSAHHMPNNQYMTTRGVSKADGVSMTVEDPKPGRAGRHREIHKELQTQNPALEPRQALAESVQRARQIYREDGLLEEIRPSLQRVIQENKATHPKLFEKGGSQ